jgi:para-nitrobenzyl esterase
MEKRALRALSILLCTVSLNAQNGFLSPTRIVRTANGPMRGISDGKVDQFLGIPYAAPPVGDLRWKAPAAASSWSGVRDAVRAGSQCVQSSGGDEDCLYLNVYRPAGTTRSQKLPVLIFIHGGGNQQGSGDLYDPSELVVKTQIIVVTINYRLNVFGFMALPSLDAEAGEPSSGNFGLMDQQAAMRWVQGNIHGFGGDPLNVAIGGESAGGIDICANLVSPTAAGLFHGAILESMYCPSASHAASIQASVPVAIALGCTDPQTAASCLRGKSEADVFAANQFYVLPGAGLGISASPNYGSSVLPLRPSDALAMGQWNPSSILIGSNHDEAAPFIIGNIASKFNLPLSVADYQKIVGAYFGSFAPSVLQEYSLSNFADPFLAYADEVTDLSPLGCQVSQVAQSLAPLAQTFRYEFNDQQAPVSGSSPDLQGAYHGAELQYIFQLPQSPTTLTPAQQQLADQMMQYWGNFIRTGNPNGPGLVMWPQFDTNSHQLLSLKPDGNSVIDNFDSDHHCAFWATAPGPPFK